MPREKSRNRDRDRRSLSYSSDSSYDRKKSKKNKRRSRSRERSVSSYKRRRSASRSRRRRSYSKSLSRERYEKSRRRSSSRSKSKRSKRDSRDRSRSRSSSRSRKHSKKSKKSRRSRSSSSHGSSFDIERPTTTEKPANLDDTEIKIEKAIKAAQAAGLTMTKLPTYEYKEVEVKEEMPTIHDRNLLAELNSDSFVQKSFTSSKSKKNNILIDLNKQTVSVSDTDLKVSTEASIINFDAIPSEEELKEMWVKKLYLYRKKMLRGEI